MGCHAGLELRILQDFGAHDVHGIEIRNHVVKAAIHAQLIPAIAVTVADFWSYLSGPPVAFYTDIFALAPEALSLQHLWNAVRPHLVESGHLVVVAQPQDVGDAPPEALQAMALEGTMHWYVMTDK